MSATPPPPPPPGYQPPPPGQASQMSPNDEKLWATLIHIGGIFFYFLPALIGYLVLKDRGPFIREHTRQALNFQLTALIGYIVSWILTFILVGLLLWLAVAVVVIIFSIMAAIAANRGQAYKYPLTIQFIK